MKMVVDGLRIKTLGGLSIEREGKTVNDFASRKAEALLVYLACAGREYPREVLADLLWDDRSQRQSMANLRVVLSSLRKEVGLYVSITRTTAAINPDSNFSLDTLQLEQAFSAVQKQGGIQSTAEAQLLASALAHYNGDFLAGYYLTEASGFESWAATERERLHRETVQAFLNLGQWYLGQQEHALTIASATRLVQIDPLSEAGHRQLMEALACNGQRAGALAHFDTLVRLLEQELEVAPSQLTMASLEAIRKEELQASSTDKVTEAWTLDPEPPPHNLPTQPTPFVGRETELAALDSFLADPDIRLITLTGPGGIGKTRLALAAAEHLLEVSEADEMPFPDGIYFVSLAPLNDIEHIAPAIAVALNFRFREGEENLSARQQLLAYLKRRRLLLIMDNYEHLLAGAGLLTDILQIAPRVQILVTSRERLLLQAEQHFPLQGLAMAGEDGQPGAESASIRLFLQAARRVQPDFAVRNASYRAHLARICHLMQGMPLAIELAASWVNTMTPEGIEVEIQQTLDFLAVERRDVPDRHHSMRALFESTWKQLGPEGRDVFARLSVFRGGFSREAAQAVAGASLSLLARLVSRSLLQYDHDTDRYQVHELLRWYAAEKLAANLGSLEESRRQHVQTFLALAERCDEEYRRTKQPEWLDQLWVEQDNLNAALQWAFAQGEIEIAGRIGGALGVFWGIRGYLQGGRQWLEAILEQQSLLSAYTLGKVFFAQGWLAFEQGDYPLAEGYYRSSYELLEERDAGPLKADLLGCLGHVAQQRANYEDAAAFSEQSLALYRRLNDKGGVALILNRLGRIAELQGDYLRAIRLLQEGLDLRQASGDERGIASSLNGLAEIARYQKRSRQAAAWYEQALATCRKLGDKRCVAGVQHNLAHVALDLADASRAIPLFQNSLLLYNELENREGVALCLAGLGRALGMQGERERAVLLLSKAKALFKGQQLVLEAADRQAFEQALAAAYGESGDPTLDSAWSRGRTLPIEAAIQTALV